MVFAENDRPGVMLSGAARHYLNHHGVAVGRKIGVYTAHDGAYPAAFDLKRAGCDIPAIVDLRKDVADALLEEAKSLGIEVLTAHSRCESGRAAAGFLDGGKAGQWRRGAQVLR